MSEAERHRPEPSRWRLFWSAHKTASAAALAAAIAGALAALVISLVQEPTYAAETSVSLRPRVADVDAAEAADRLAANLAAWAVTEKYAFLLTSQETAGLTPREIAGNAKARAVVKEMRVQVAFEDSDPQRAASVANGLARVLVEEGTRSLRFASPAEALEVEQMDKASAPPRPVWPRPEIAIPAGAVLGLAAGALLGALLGWLTQPVGAAGGAPAKVEMP